TVSVHSETARLSSSRRLPPPSRPRPIAVSTRPLGTLTVTEFLLGPDEMPRPGMAPEGDGATAYPIRLDVRRDEHQRRLTNFPIFIGTIIRIILLAPHYILLYLLYLVQATVYLIIPFAILFTGRYPP